MNSAKRKQLLPVLAFFLAAGMATAAHGERKHWGPQPDQGFAPSHVAQQHISIQQAIAIVQRETGGRVLDARDQGQQYRIKVLTPKGEVRIVYVDAATGAMR
jgi:uncharacterized membrane protein YkoI